MTEALSDFNKFNFRKTSFKSYAGGNHGGWLAFPWKNAGYDCNKYVAAFEKLTKFEGNIDEALQAFRTHPLTRDRALQ